MKNKQKLLFPFLIVIILFGIFFINRSKKNVSPLNNGNNTPTVTISSSSQLIDRFEYQGVDGVDALTLLKQKTTIEQDSAGMVVSISGRQADNSNREFWSFYINDESAQVGPASYITKSNDIISWKIEKY